MNTTHTFEMNSALPHGYRFACLAQGKIKAHSEIGGEAIHCTSGHLWITLEDDGIDHILIAGESLSVPNSGKVVVSGPGCYHISSGTESEEILLAS